MPLAFGEGDEVNGNPGRRQPPPASRSASPASSGPAAATGAAGRWDPGQYHMFSDHRRRPALELLARAPPADPGLAVDLGCGTGEVTRLIAERWPGAAVQGVDHSPDMLARARAGDAEDEEGAGDEEGAAGTAGGNGGKGEAVRVEWIEADIAAWSPASPPGLLYANASLQWVDGHEELFPRLLRSLAPGGVLAVQMPLSREARSHRLMHEVLAGGGPDGAPLGSESLRREIARRWVLDPAEYFDLLATAGAARIDVWTTEYLQALQGEDPVLEWVSGTGLRPILNGLAGEERVRFLDRYRAALRDAYPRRPDGATLYPFRRLFIVAVRA